jgi:hypothetical protein
MKKTFYSIVFAAILVSLSGAPDALAACTQGGQCSGGTCVQYLYNIGFNQTCTPQVWMKNNMGAATFVKSGGTAMCGGFFSSYAQMNYNNGNFSVVTQSVTIPSTETRTTWTAGWNISVTDPHADAGDELYVEFYDSTANTTLGTSSSYLGSGADPNCRLDTLSLGTHNLAGHTIIVTIHAFVDYTDTHFFITNVQLDAS